MGAKSMLMLGIISDIAFSVRSDLQTENEALWFKLLCLRLL